MKHAVIVYSSPAGTTRHVAGVMQRRCLDFGIPTREVDLGSRPDLEAVLASLADQAEDGCLFIGSPVYVSHAVPPVMDFIDRLPPGTGLASVPFVTWGGASSGMALYEMARALARKGMPPVGAAKILAVHSMMWRAKTPLGEGHPDAEDDRLAGDLVRRVHDHLRRGDRAAIPLEGLCRHPQPVRAEMARNTLAQAAAHMPAREVAVEACTVCGLCAARCPTDAITLEPTPRFGRTCIYCFRCVRECPENAIRADLSGISPRIRGRAAQFDEQPLSQIFYAGVA